MTIHQPGAMPDDLYARAVELDQRAWNGGPGRYRVRVLFARYPKFGGPMFFYLYVHRWDTGQSCRIGFHHGDKRSEKRLSGSVDEGDDVEIFIHDPDHPRAAVGETLICGKQLVPYAVAEEWTKPRELHGPLGLPFLIQPGAAPRIMVIGLKPNSEFDEADFTQAYDDVTTLPAFVQRLHDISWINRLMMIAAKDHRPTEVELTEFQIFIRGVPGGVDKDPSRATIGKQEKGIHPVTVCYTWLHAHPHRGGEKTLESTSEDEIKTGEARVRELFQRFQPELVVLSGSATIRRIPRILGVIDASARLNQLMIPMDNPRTVALRINDRNYEFLPAYDLRRFGRLQIGADFVPPTYWADLRQVMCDWLRRIAPPPAKEDANR